MARWGENKILNKLYQTAQNGTVWRQTGLLIAGKGGGEPLIRTVHFPLEGQVFLCVLSIFEKWPLKRSKELSKAEVAGLCGLIAKVFAIA